MKIKISKKQLTKELTKELLTIPHYRELPDSEQANEIADMVGIRQKEIKHFNKQKLLPIKNGCCERAQAFHCVCARSYFCPIHGETHIGSHD